MTPFFVGGAFLTLKMLILACKYITLPKLVISIKQKLNRNRD